MIKKSLLLLLVVLFVPKAVTAQEIYAVLSSDKETLTLYYDTKKDSRSGTVYEYEFVGFDNWWLPSWYASHETVITIVLDQSMKNARPTTVGTWFHGFEKLEAIKHLDYLDTREVERMAEMFSDCKSLTTLGLSNFDTSKVTTMYCMFDGCESLTTLDVSNFDMSNMIIMSCMFYN